MAPQRAGARFDRRNGHLTAQQRPGLPRARPLLTTPFLCSCAAAGTSPPPPPPWCRAEHGWRGSAGPQLSQAGQQPPLPALIPACLLAALGARGTALRTPENASNSCCRSRLEGYSLAPVHVSPGGRAVPKARLVWLAAHSRRHAVQAQAAAIGAGTYVRDDSSMQHEFLGCLWGVWGEQRAVTAADLVLKAQLPAQEGSCCQQTAADVKSAQRSLGRLTPWAARAAPHAWFNSRQTW